VSRTRRKSRKPARVPSRTAPGPVALPAPRPIVAAPAWAWWLAAGLVAAAAAVTYFPTLDNDFVTWDDPDYVTNNVYVTGNQQISPADGLRTIWDPRAEHEQYYPLLFTSFWIEYRLWGPDAGGYHLTNLVLHALDAALVVWVLRLLGVGPWVAWLAAALFALHPINVASVAWVTERKNVLSMLFYLLAFGTYLSASRRAGPDRRAWLLYGGCLLLFVLGLLSKTAVLTLPVSALLADRLIHRRWPLLGFVRVLPMLLLSLLAAIHTSVVEHGNASSIVPLEPLYRPLVAAGALWFYLGKLVVPLHFPGVYPRWDPSASWPIFTVALLGLIVTAAVLWRFRRRVPGHVHWGLLHFVVALSPMLGLIPFNYTQYSFVADHFVYHASIGFFLAVAVLLHALAQKIPMERLHIALPSALAGGALAALAVISYRQCDLAWRDAEHFWVNTVMLNPGCFPAQYNLANLYLRENRPEEAVAHYRLAAQARPDLHQPVGRMARTLVRLNRREEALAAFDEAIARVEFHKVDWTSYRHEAARLLVQFGRLDEAERRLREAAQGKESLARTHLELARFLRDRGRLREAIESFEAALAAQNIGGRRAAVQQELAAVRQRLGS
jgi:tetratricopeptide (TPR) repeat protein